MFLVELVMQGVRGFQQLVRLRFQGGFNFISAGNEGGKTTSADSMVRLLFPVNDPSRMNELVSRSQPEGSRGAMVVYSDDGSYYRVIQDFSKHAVNLSKYNAATKEFSLLQKDWDSISRFMEGQHPGIAEEEYNRLFVLRRDMPAEGVAAGSQAPVAPAAAAAPSPRPAAAPAPSTAQQAKLAELKEAMRKAEEAADAEYKAEAARVRLGELAKKRERVDEVRNRTAELEAQLAELKNCENMPDNLPELLSSHEQEESRKLAKTDDLDKDIESLTLQRDSMPSANLVTDKLFIAGVAIAGLALIAGVVSLEGSDIYFPIGILAGLFLVAAAWYNGTRKNAQRSAVQQEIDDLVKDRAEIEKKFQAGAAAILKYMQATGSSSAAELKEKADNYRYFSGMLHDLEEQRNMALGGQTIEEIDAEYGRQQQEVEQLAQNAKALSQYAVDVYSLRQEIERIEGASAPAAEPAHDMGFGDMSAEFGMPSFGGPAHAAGAGGASFLADLAVASRVSGIEMETLVPAVESAAQRNISAMSSGKYVRIEAGHDGEPVVHDKNGEKIPFGSLSHGTRELTSFCLRAGLVEAIAGKRRLPFILDDPFTGMDHARQQIGCQILRILGTKTQVILFTSNPALKAPNDPSAELK